MAEVVRMSVVRVFVVDDVEDWRRWVASMLRTEPFKIIGEASNGLDAVYRVAQMQPTVVLLDIGLPKLNGIEAGVRIRRVAPDSKILYLSQEFDPDIVRAALQLGAFGYVLKSDAARELVEAIHTVVQGKKFISSGVAGHHFKIATEGE
jgi:DNA-binding NarL/FixJ family response regulator